MRSIVLIAHNLRSTHNVGSLLRTASGVGVERVFLTGYTPYPHISRDARLPHLAKKLDAQIHKTALGAEKSLDIEHAADIKAVLEKLRSQHYLLCALEQTPRAMELPKFQPRGKIAIIVGREVEGIEPEVLDLVDVIAEIPMLGQKESLNVVQAAAMALYHFRFVALPGTTK